MTKEIMLKNMNREEFFFLYEYRIEQGIETLKKQSLEITEVFSSGFTYKGHEIFSTPFSLFNRWHQAGTDEYQYVYTIFLTADENIENYLPCLKKIISKDIQCRIKNLQQLLDVVQSE